MILRPPISTRTDTLFPYTTLFRSAAARDQCLAQRLEILDDAVVHECNLARGVRVRVARRRRAVRRPAGVGDTHRARRGMGREFLDQIGEFPFCAATDQRAVLARADPGRIIAARFTPAHPADPRTPPPTP